MLWIWVAIFLVSCSLVTSSNTTCGVSYSVDDYRFSYGSNPDIGNFLSLTFDDRREDYTVSADGNAAVDGWNSDGCYVGGMGRNRDKYYPCFGMHCNPNADSLGYSVTVSVDKCSLKLTGSCFVNNIIQLGDDEVRLTLNTSSMQSSFLVQGHLPDRTFGVYLSTTGSVIGEWIYGILFAFPSSNTYLHYSKSVIPSKWVHDEWEYRTSYGYLLTNLGATAQSYYVRRDALLNGGSYNQYLVFKMLPNRYRVFAIYLVFCACYLACCGPAFLLFYLKFWRAVRSRRKGSLVTPDASFAKEIPPVAPVEVEGVRMEYYITMYLRKLDVPKLRLWKKKKK